MAFKTPCALFTVASLAASWSCSSAPDAEPLGTVSTALESWGARFEQVLRVNTGETTVRNRCELTLDLGGPARPLTFVATTGGVTESVGWKGTATSNGQLTVSGCAGDPCEVTATWRTSGGNGSVAACTLVADDGTERHTATSTGTALTVSGAPSATLIFNQDVKVHAATTAIAGSCTLRQSAVLSQAQVADLGVFVDGAQVLDVPGPTAIGNVAFPKKLGPVVFGTLYVGADAEATRLKHVTPLKEQLDSSNAIRCEGAYRSSSGVPVFDVNLSATPVGNGMQIAPGATGWTCNASKFGTNDGCDCDCGIVDPDCAVDQCGCDTETEHDNGVGQSFYDCEPVGTYDVDQALAACGAFTGDVTKCFDYGVTCDSNDDVTPDTAVVCGDASTVGDCACWAYSGPAIGYVYNDAGGNNCFCPLIGDPQWD